MSILSSQVDALRKTADMADALDDFERVSIPWMRNKLTPMLREAADTIESLRDKLQESERHNRINLEVMGEMYHPEIVELIQECHATQANYEHCKYSTDRGWCDTSRYSELFSTPERAAQTLMGICDECDESACSGCKIDPLVGYATNYDALLEWLKGVDA